MHIKKQQVKKLTISRCGGFILIFAILFCTVGLADAKFHYDTVSEMDGGLTQIEHGSMINTHGAAGIFSAEKVSLISVGDSVTIITGGKYAIGAAAYKNANIDIGDRLIVGTSGRSSHGAYANDNATIHIGGDATIATLGDLSYGVSARDISIITVGEGANISTTGEASHGVYADRDSRIVLKGAAISVAGSDSYAVYSERGSGVIGTGKFNISGDIKADARNGRAETIVDLTLEDGSTFVGKASYSGKNAKTKLNLQGTDTLWAVTGSSELTNLDNAGVVDFTASEEFSTVTVKELGDQGADGGTFIMRADVVNQREDKLVVTDTTSGVYNVDVLNNGALHTTGKESAVIVKTADTNGEFALVNDSVELGGWKYQLRQSLAGNGGADWELTGIGELSNAASNAIGTFKGAYMLSYAETTFMQRMGDLRSSPHLAGLWARTYGGQYENKSSGHVKGFDMDTYGINIGYDRKLGTSLNGELYVGGFFGYNHGDMDPNGRGGGTIESQSLGLYASFLSPNGFYADTVLKYSWRSSDFDTYDSAGSHVTGNEVHTSGFGWSVELGQRISVAGTPKNGWYVEPQAQISHQRYGEGYYNLSNNLRVGAEGFTSIIGRVGMLIGYESERANFYGKISRVKEFDGDVKFHMNDNSAIAESFGDSWWAYGVGYTAKLSDNNSLYFDIERTSGADFEQKWQLNLGWRIEF